MGNLHGFSGFSGLLLCGAVRSEGKDFDRMIF